MTKSIAHFLIYAVLAIGLIGAGQLVWTEISHPSTCPKLLGIPACYIILACFAVPFVMHLLGKSAAIYFAFTGLAFVIALIASFMQLFGNGECPKTSGGMPMCYYSLALFTSLIGLKLWLSRLEKKRRIR